MKLTDTDYNRLDGTGKSVIIVIDNTGNMVGKLVYIRTKGGTVYAYLWDWTDKTYTPDIQRGKAGGGGYDKRGAAIYGMKFGSVTLADKDAEKQFKDMGYHAYEV